LSTLKTRRTASKKKKRLPQKHIIKQMHQLANKTKRSYSKNRPIRPQHNWWSSIQTKLKKDAKLLFLCIPKRMMMNARKAHSPRKLK